VSGLTVDPLPRELRLGSAVRGLIIGGLVAIYAWVFDNPGASFAVALLVAAGLQLVVLLLRKVVPTFLIPQALHVFELIVDAATVLLFALGVFGGILQSGYDA
jgi:hypothetical protein